MFYSMLLSRSAVHMVTLKCNIVCRSYVGWITGSTVCWRVPQAVEKVWPCFVLLWAGSKLSSVRLFAFWKVAYEYAWSKNFMFLFVSFSSLNNFLFVLFQLNLMKELLSWRTRVSLIKFQETVRCWSPPPHVSVYATPNPARQLQQLQLQPSLLLWTSLCHPANRKSSHQHQNIVSGPLFCLYSIWNIQMLSKPVWVT